ncbi:methyltransferase, FxLD system [Kitasatospora kifunensis]
MRNRMVDSILTGHHLTPAVEEAMRTVPRHEFVPGATIEKAYADEAVTIKENPAGGLALSCASVPSLVGDMLVQLDARPGDRVAEIGAGTGYNAALLAHIVGPEGDMTTIDIDLDVTAHARRRLDATGYQRVRVLSRDGSLGSPEYAPFAGIVVTVGAWDLPWAWHDQLADGGRLVVPLRWRGQTRSIAFIRQSDLLVSDSAILCGFVPMIGHDGELTGAIDPDALVTLYWDKDQAIDPDALQGVLALPGTVQGSGVTVGGMDPFDGIWLRLAATDPATCRIAAERAAVDSGLCSPAIPVRSPALVDGDSLVYLTKRRLPTEPRWELTATWHGPTGQHLADRLCEAIRTWDKDREAVPVITAYPAGIADEVLGGVYVVDKPGARLAFAYS